MSDVYSDMLMIFDKLSQTIFVFMVEMCNTYLLRSINNTS